METTTTTSQFFYQSAIVNYVKVDLSNPLHKELYEMFVPGGLFPSIDSYKIKEATKLMKKIEGFEQSESLNNTPAWSSDLFLRTMNVDENGDIVYPR